MSKHTIGIDGLGTLTAGRLCCEPNLSWLPLTDANAQLLTVWDERIGA
jgi:hypothetical protein